MSARVGSLWVRGMMLKLFLVLVFFIHYQTIGVVGTLHSWVLLGGFALTLPTLMHRWIGSNFRVRFDDALIALMGGTMLIGFASNVGDATTSQLQAYLLALVCYLFVRENAALLSSRFLPRLLTLFLLSNSVLMILQFWTGSFFVARYLADTNAAFLLPSGVSDGPTKNGMLHAFALSAVFAQLLWERRRGPVESVVFLIGLIAVLLTASRAGIVAFCGSALAVLMLFAVSQHRHVKSQRRSPLKTYALATIVLLLFVRLIVAIPDLANRMELNYAANVIAYKFSIASGTDVTIEDGSVDTRFQQAGRAVRLALSSPAHLLAAGFGPGSFEQTIGLNVHNSYLEFGYEIGLIALMVLLGLTLVVVRRAIRSSDLSRAAPMLGGLVAMMIFMLFHDVLRGRMFWIPLGMLSALGNNKSIQPVATISTASEERTE